MTPNECAILIAWYRREYKRRTDALRRGASNIDWLTPEYRVSRTEIQSFADSAGIALNVNDWREFQLQLNNMRKPK
jgi:hypothetical protein